MEVFVRGSQALSYPAFELEEILEVLIVLLSVMDPRVDTLQQLGHGLSIQDVDVFVYATYKDTHRLPQQNYWHHIVMLFEVCFKCLKWCLLFKSNILR